MKKATPSPHRRRCTQNAERLRSRSPAGARRAASMDASMCLFALWHTPRPQFMGADLRFFAARHPIGMCHTPFYCICAHCAHIPSMCQTAFYCICAHCAHIPSMCQTAFYCVSSHCAHIPSMCQTAFYRIRAHCSHIPAAILRSCSSGQNEKGSAEAKPFMSLV